MNTHYVCDECGGVSDIPKNCGTEGCSLNGTPLKECNCDNSEHLQKAEASRKANEEKNE